MKLVSNSFNDGAPIPTRYAFGKMDTQTHVALSDNINPHMAWSEAPEGTRSFALICHDPDVPSKGDDVNQEGKTVPATLPRVDFYHWVLFNIPATVSEIAEGSHCNGVTPRGKSGPEAPQGMMHGINDYTAWFAGDADMKGDYFGYDGPCPPWNDELMHHYVFSIYALDTDQIEVDGEINGKNLYDAIEMHVIDGASIRGTYTLNPTLEP
ncbi:Phospholipid-binding protein [Marinobacterium lacunae]|uniref:Phospholipid-binding protein n=1 Tax=Marinobacterium lacunae TaxID=1232683 RepID=A0A081FUU0_9GAMM|nr:YbhB/YbcL family Raf kinase inhibitor-like protein [Marinobacterium lacunae]KEA62295.1 Phospholipid-binding protein [Marinobacterium lacunae]MBR9883591.1 YbhB/YbcL family Raf kinase inhibitor-like protein [Oceanospirillales bacterium]